VNIISNRLFLCIGILVSSSLHAMYQNGNGLHVETKVAKENGFKLKSASSSQLPKAGIPLTPVSGGTVSLAALMKLQDSKHASIMHQPTSGSTINVNALLKKTEPKKQVKEKPKKVIKALWSDPLPKTNDSDEWIAHVIARFNSFREIERRSIQKSSTPYLMMGTTTCGNAHCSFSIYDNVIKKYNLREIPFEDIVIYGYSDGKMKIAYGQMDPADTF
jgi:hypothetical protein